MLPEPVKKMTLDATLRSNGNGTLPRKILEPLIGGGQLYGPAARFYNLMVKEAEKDGVELNPSASGYRSLEQQRALFLDRFVPRPTTRVPKVSRQYQGKTWWLKRGKSPCATPGTSPHGWGLAQDIDVRDPRVFRWLCRNAPQFGFYLQGTRLLPNGKQNPEYEAWHWQFCNL